jgi:hypothetical protein
MAGNLGTLTLDLVAKIGGFTGPMDKASRQAKKNSADIAKASKAMGAAIGASAVAAVAGIALIVNRQRDLIDQQAKAAQVLDTTYVSLSNLERAGELGGVGMEKINAASRQLNLNLGRAIQGTDAQVEAFDRLGLSAQAVYDLPLDKRIATINKALIDNVQASERAAVAADIFGAKNAKAMQMLDPATIAEAARQVDIFGLNLSDVDAAKVEMANDAMSTFGLLSSGAAKQLTVELAPILRALGDEFLRSAEAAGGLGAAVNDAASSAVSALSFVIDAGDGVKRVFEITASAMIASVTSAVGKATSIIATFDEMVDRIPGVDISRGTKEIRDFSNAQLAIAEQASAGIQEALETPLAGTAFRQFYADAQSAGQAAAESAVKGRESAKEGGAVFVAAETEKAKAAKTTTDAIAGQLSALELQVATLGMSSDEVALYTLALDGATEAQLAQAAAALKTVDAYTQQAEARKAADEAQGLANSDADAVIESLRTEEEEIAASYERRRATILASSIHTAEEKNEALLRLEEEHSEQMLEAGDSYWERYLAASEEALTSFDDLAASVVENFSTRFGDAFESMVFDAQTLEESVANMAEGMARAVVNALGQMAAQWLAYQLVQMLVGKTAQSSAATTMIANASATSAQAALAAFASTAAIPIVGPLLAPAAAAAATAATIPMVAAVSGFALAGMAHSGIDSVPQDGTWLLQKGERVTTAETSAKLDGVLSDIRSSRTSGSSSGQVINISMPGITSAKEAREASGSVRRSIAQGVAASQRNT